MRLFALSSFVSLALEALLSLMAIGLVFSSSSNSSSSSFIPSLCQSLSNADLSLESFFGWSAEQCEERFGSFLFTALSLLAVVSILRAGATVKVLSYYTHLSKRSRRKPALSIDIGRPGLARDRYSDRDDSASKRPHHHSAHRIFLLPDPVDSKKDDGPVAGVDVPLLSLTASSPATASFPPQPAGVSQLVPDEHAVPMASPQRFLVYAPVSRSPSRASWINVTDLLLLLASQVMMTPDEARRAGAREISLGGHSRPRSRSNVAAASPISPQPLSTTSETQTPLTAVPEVGAGNGKGKLA